MGTGAKRGLIAGVVCLALVICGAILLNLSRPPAATLMPLGQLSGDLPAQSTLETDRQPLQPSGDAQADAQALLDAVQEFSSQVTSFRVRQTRHYTGTFSTNAPIRSVIVGEKPNRLVLRYENWAGALAFVADGGTFCVCSEIDLGPSLPDSQKRYLAGDGPDSMDAILRHVGRLSISPPTHAFPELEMMALLPFTDDVTGFLGSRGWGTVRWIGTEDIDGRTAEHLVCTGRVCRLKAEAGPGPSEPAEPADPDSEPEESKLHLWIDAEGPPLLRKASLNDFMMTYADWALNPVLPPGTFQLPATHDYQQIAFDFPEGGSWVGRRAPELALATLDGERHQLSDARGNVVVLSFWATWCGPCLKELPIVSGIVERFADRDVRLLAVTQETDVEKIHGTLQRLNLEIEAAIDIDQQSSSFGVVGIPHLVVIDRQGEIRAVHVGLTSGLEEELREELERLTQK
ncbi:Thiol-disulfide oxidoreductase ResA [Maioricimonas rarisocia]|uniref:Thiol-disulfide oxidoreductase ResA n=1 Tax=Maioricimonas rarisocia TaxID=2528026 RepID=A0A517Z2I9_9PLAN|nr:redoxin domain-containing protein [Maioricimonas rarisocia]QDU36686.1 Thiol-disulfide oxidoreductase ResA [Maioricimonas rarisocia]